MEKDMFSTRTARKCAEISRILEKEESRSHVRRVAHILKKSEHDRSDEEKLLLLNSVDIVLNIEKRANSRMLTKQRLLEIEDSEDVLREKCAKLAEAIRDARHVVIYTGAGISTAASIPDYRGPNGVWTLLQQGKEVMAPQLSDAEPTYTHMCITYLYRHHLVKHVVSQNCDALHLRSGLPRHALSELHGNMYIEVCNTCEHPREYIRLFDLTERTGVRRHQTGRQCSHCRAQLHDTIVHFGEKGRLTSPYNWKEAAQMADHADLVLCLGTSLKVLRKYPCLWSMHKPPADRPKLYIVNLQWTPKDDVAALKINGRSDEVMKYVTTHLNLPVKPYVREEDPIFVMATRLAPHELETTSTKTLVEPPGYKRGKMEAILLSNVAASQKLVGRSKTQKRKKQSDSCSRKARTTTEQQKSSRKNKEERDRMRPETDVMNESPNSKRCKKNTWMRSASESELCDEHSLDVAMTTQDGMHHDDWTGFGVTVSKSDTAVVLSDSAKKHHSQSSRSAAALVSHQCDNSDRVCDISADNNSGTTGDNLCDEIGMALDNPVANCDKFGILSGKTSVCILEHSYCRSCAPSSGSGMKQPMCCHLSPPVIGCINNDCQHGNNKVGLSHGSGILRSCQEQLPTLLHGNVAVSSVAATVAVPAITDTPSTTNAPPFTHIRTYAVRSPGCSTIGCCHCSTNVESSKPECSSGLDSVIPPAQGIGVVCGELLPECPDTTATTSSGISHSSSTMAVEYRSTCTFTKTFCPAQNLTIATSCNLPESAVSDVSKGSGGKQFSTIIKALQAGHQQSTDGPVKQGNTDPSAEVTPSPEPHSELISCTPTHECKEIKPEHPASSVPDGATVNCEIYVTQTSELEVKPSGSAAMQYAGVSQEPSASHITGRSGGTPSSDSSTGVFREKGCEPGMMGSSDVKSTQIPDTGRTTITANSPGWFGKGLNLRKTRRKKSW